MVSPVMPTYARAPLSFVRGEGSWLEDEKGRRYLDAGSGIAVSILGHAHPKLVAALTEQAASLWHTSNLYQIPQQEQLAEMLVEATFADTVVFSNSGAEACEAAVKIARRYWHVSGDSQKNEILTFNSSFHGRTLSMISASGNSKYTDGFGPLTPGFTQVVPNNIDALKREVNERTAAVMVEPVIGEGGIVPLSDRFLKEVRQLCDDCHLLLIVDEVQCGVGRTGKLFAHEWAGIKPDVMAIAKGIGGGFPIGACLATEEAAKGMTAGTHGSTYGGNPLACRVAIEVLRIVNDADFLSDVRRKAGRMRQRMESVVATHQQVFAEVRGTGLMLGLVCKIPNTDVISAAYEKQLLLVPAADNTVRILPPLNIDVNELDEICDRISDAADEMSKVPAHA